MHVTTARQKVMAYLKKNHAVSAAQIGRGLSMSAADVRHHLALLCSDGRAVQVGVLHKGGRGRPIKLYGLSENSSANNLGLLSDLILDIWLDTLPPEKMQEGMRALAEALIHSIGPPDIDIPVASRLAQIMDKLNELNYQARWEAGAEGPRILFGHCPYSAIIEKHPELCQMDAAVLAKFLGQSAQQKAKIGKGGNSACLFQMS